MRPPLCLFRPAFADMACRWVFIRAAFRFPALRSLLRAIAVPFLAAPAVAAPSALSAPPAADFASSAIVATSSRASLAASSALVPSSAAFSRPAFVVW